MKKRLSKFRKLYNHYMQKKILDETIHVIILDKPAEEEDGPRALCSCGWNTPYSTNLIGLGRAAKKHSEETGHKLRSHR